MDKNRITLALADLRGSLAAVLAIYPEDEDDAGQPIRYPHETMLRNVLRSLAPDGPIEQELRMAIMQAYSKEIA